MNKLEQLTEAIQEAVPDIMRLKRGCEIVMPRGNSDREWNIRTYITGYSEIPDRIGRKLNKENIKFIPVLQEYRTNKNKLNINIEIRVNEIIKILGRDITLEDCLIAFLNSKPRKDKIIIQGQIVCRWAWGKSLHQQEDKTIDFLHDLIGIGDNIELIKKQDEEFCNHSETQENLKTFIVKVRRQRAEMVYDKMIDKLLLVIGHSERILEEKEIKKRILKELL